VKYVILVIVILVAWFIITSHLKKASRRRNDGAARSEDMVRCVHCGVHLPRSESVMSEELFYCSTDHRRLHQSKSG
jgi:uncharacterized protein